MTNVGHEYKKVTGHLKIFRDVAAWFLIVYLSLYESITNPELMDRTLRAGVRGWLKEARRVRAI